MVVQRHEHRDPIRIGQIWVDIAESFLHLGRGGLVVEAARINVDALPRGAVEIEVGFPILRA